MKNSNTCIRELSAKYRSILKKCAFLNAIIIMSAVPFAVNASNTIDYTGKNPQNGVDETVIINSENTKGAAVIVGGTEISGETTSITATRSNDAADKGVNA